MELLEAARVSRKRCDLGGFHDLWSVDRKRVFETVVVGVFEECHVNGNVVGTDPFVRKEVEHDFVEVLDVIHDQDLLDFGIFKICLERSKS